MAYRLDLAADPPETLRAGLSEQLDDAVRSLRDDRAEDPVTAVHEARKDLKKARSLLRLARPAMPRDAYRRANADLRDTGRSLSAARDADVLVATAEDLGERFAGRLPGAQFAALRDVLAREAADARRTEGDSAEDAAARLEAIAARAAEWPLDACERGTLVAGATREYERGRAALAAAEADPSVEHLHELRKRVKDLWHHGRLLEEAWPRVMKAEAKAAHDLSDVLGDDHDLAVLAERVRRGVAIPAGTPVDDDAVVDLIALRRAGLQAEAMPLARRLYAEPPKAFHRRLSAYVAAAAAKDGAAEAA
jgi:CHAD domain-containing protein